MTSESRGRARIGVLVPFTNTNLEPDMTLLAPPGVSIHVARMGGYDADEVPDETQMEGLGSADLSGPLALLSGARPGVVLYGCTSATLTHGPAFDAALARQIAETCGAPGITAAGALADALKALGAQRIGFASPYVGAINDRAVAFLAGRGIETVVRADVGRVLDNEGQGALTPDEVFGLALRADGPGVEALVLSCTDMRSVEALERIEQAVGKPVICSNQALMFAALRRLGIDAGRRAVGKLMGAADQPVPG